MDFPSAVSIITVQKDSLELAREKSQISWTRKHSTVDDIELMRDRQCYDQFDGIYEDRCGKRGRHHSISMDPNIPIGPNMKKKISFSAKTCRCTNSRCDCYNAQNENADREEDKTNGLESDLETEVADSWKEGVSVGKKHFSCPGDDSDKDSMNIIMAIQGDKKVTDESSLAASQFLDFNNT
nr:unnamed protein product [Callosobruchus analis]